MQFRIEKLIQGGAGLATDSQGKRVLIEGALPSELVEVSIVEEKPGFNRGQVDAILEASSDRVEPACPYWGICGGCDFQYASEESQGRLKQSIILDNLTRLGNVDISQVQIDETCCSPGWGYRNRVRFHVDIAKRSVGFLGRKSNTLISIGHCPILNDKLNNLLAQPEPVIAAARLLMFSNRTGKGGFVEVPAFAGDTEVSLLGKVVQHTVGGHTFFVSSDVFFQSNEKLVAPLGEYVKEHAIGDRVMDLYSGIGTFSMFLQAGGRHLVAVERQKQCLGLAKQHLKGIEFYTEAVENWAKGRMQAVDTVVVDPPRTGLDASLPALIASWNSKRIIYVSCNSVTLGRDLQRFALEGYTLKQVKVFDLYPQTFHHEVVAILDR